MRGQEFHQAITTHWLKLMAALWLLISLTAYADDSILIIKSNDNSFFNTSIEQLINDTDSNVKYKIATVDQLEKNPESFSNSNLITYEKTKKGE